MLSIPPDNARNTCEARITRQWLDQAQPLAAGQHHRFDRCSFDDEDLGGLDLSGAEFVDCTLLRTRLDRALLACTRWRGCRCAGASFELADVTDAAFAQCDLNNTNWRRARLSSAGFHEVKLTGATFIEARTLGLQFQAALLISTDLRGLSFRKQTLERLNFSSADLAGCDFSDAVLIDCDLTDASLKNARFERADLRRSRLGALQVGDLQRQFKGSIISVDQAAGLIAALGVHVV